MKITKKGHKRLRNRRSSMKELRRPKKSKAIHGSSAGGFQPSPPSQVDLPMDFRLSVNFSETAGCISALRHHLSRGVRGGRTPYINFNNIAMVDHAAALMLAAEIHAWNLKNPHIKLRSDDKNWNADIAELLSDMGLFDLLGVTRQGPPSMSRGRDKIFLQFISGSTEEEFSRNYIKYREEIESETQAPLLRVPLIVGLGEAVVNAEEHSQKGREGDARWWVSASYSKTNRELGILCYDRGLGIPQTLPQSGMRERVYRFLSEQGWSDRIDCDLIAAAMMSPHRRTSTGNPRRGRGIRQFMDFIKKSDQGELRVYSRKGMVRYAKSCADERGKFHKKQLNKPINGTLIEWRAVLPSGGAP